MDLGAFFNFLEQKGYQKRVLKIGKNDGTETPETKLPSSIRRGV
jgi:hypothetical protein